MCFYDALTFEGRGYSGADCVLGISYWPDFWARVFLGYLVYDLIAMLAIRYLPGLDPGLRTLDPRTLITVEDQRRVYATHYLCSCHSTPFEKMEWTVTMHGNICEGRNLERH